MLGVIPLKRQYMINYREKHNLTRQDMAKKCETSTAIIAMLEDCDQEVTHPKIAKRIGKQYHLKKKQTESLMPEHYRDSSPNYDPDLYRRNKDELKQISIISRKWL